MLKHCLAVLAAGGALALMASEELPAEVKTQSDGSFSIGALSYSQTAFNPQWHGVENKQWTDVKSRSERTGLRVSGEFTIDASRVRASENLLPTGTDAMRLESRMEFTPPAKLNALFGAFTFPVGGGRITVDGREIAVPEKPGELNLFSGGAQQVTLQGDQAAELVITGVTSLQIVDNRLQEKPVNNISLRFGFKRTGDAGGTATAALDLGIRIRRFKTQMLPLSAAINRSYRDEPGEKLPGWTAQGRDNDLRMFTPGDMTVRGVPFRTEKAGVVAVGGQERAGAVPEVVLDLPESSGMRALNLLHTSAWTPAAEFAEMEVVYADGSRQTIPVSGLRDCADWVTIANLPNAALAWSGSRDDGSLVGVFFSSFPLKGDRPVQLIFRARLPQIFHLILAATLSEKPVPLTAEDSRILKILPGRDWVGLDFDNRPIPGSAVDFSFLADAPAGKYGYVKASPDGTLTFEKAPDKRLRLFGVNFCQSANFPDRETAEWLADSLVRSGYNTVRFHHHDNPLADSKSPGSTAIDPENLDRLEYFIAALKKRGIYLTTDVYTSRKIKPGDGLPMDREIKALFIENEKAMDNWKAFARNWLTHRNPYTGMTLAEDPALVFVNLVNENHVFAVWNATSGDREAFIKRFAEWKKRNRCPDANPDNSDPRFNSFLMEMQNASHDEMSRFLRQELGMRALITGLNNECRTALSAMRSRFDAVDNHLYQAHPSFLGKSWNSSQLFSQKSSMSRMAGTPRWILSSRVTGKPFFVTEYSYCKPNRFRSEGGPMIGGYAALQNWDGLYRFCYSHNIERVVTKTEALHGFESVNEPLQQLSDRITSALFVRGDAAPAREAFSYAIPADPCIDPDTPAFPAPRFTTLGLISGIGVHVAGQKLPPGTRVIPENAEFSAAGKPGEAWKRAIETGVAISSTGELALDSRKETFAVNTPKTESLTLKKGGLSTGNVLSVSGAEDIQTVAAIALDGENLAASRRILVLQLTDISNTGAVLEESAAGSLIRKSSDLGQLPLLVRRARANVTLKLAGKSAPRITALSPDGAKRGDVTGKFQNGVLSFTADPGAFPGGVMAYEIVR